MMKLLAVAVILLASASISFGQAAGGGVPGPSTGGTCGTNNIPCTNTTNTFTQLQTLSSGFQTGDGTTSYIGSSNSGRSVLCFDTTACLARDTTSGGIDLPSITIPSENIQEQVSPFSSIVNTYSTASGGANSVSQLGFVSQLGDHAGADKWVLNNNLPANVASIDSLGRMVILGDFKAPSIGVTTPGTGAFTTLAVGGSQALASVQGTAGTKLPAASGSFTNGNLRSTNSTGDEVDSGVSTSTVARVSNAITSATAGSGISAVTCTTAACTNLRGTYTMTATTVSAGATILTLVWPTTTTAYACLVSQDGGTLAIAPSHSVATATGMAIVSDLAITSGSIGIDYSCQP